MSKKMGRPTRPPVAGERIQLGVQCAPRIKALLEEAAEQNHRSLSREAEFRLEQSFESDRLARLETVLAKLAYALVPGLGQAKRLMTTKDDEARARAAIERTIAAFEALEAVPNRLPELTQIRTELEDLNKRLEAAKRRQTTDAKASSRAMR